MKRATRNLLTIVSLSLMLGGIIAATWFELGQRQHSIQASNAGKLDAPAKRSRVRASLPPHILAGVLPDVRPNLLQKDKSPLVPDHADPETIIETVKDAAMNGNPAAMREMAKALHTCANHKRESEKVAADVVASNAISEEDSRRSQGQPVSDSDMERKARRQFNEQMEIIGSCKRVDLGNFKSWFNWLEDAAKAGDPEAEREYSQASFMPYANEIPSELSGAILSEMQRRRSLAFQFDSDRLAHHDCSVLGRMPFDAPDATSSYVYQIAYDNMQRLNMTIDNPQRAAIEAVLSSIEARKAASVPQSNLAYAQVTAAYIDSEYCGG